MGKLEKNTCKLADFCPKTSLMYIVCWYITSDRIWQGLSSGGSRCYYPICIFMNIYENLKNGLSGMQFSHLSIH